MKRVTKLVAAVSAAALVAGSFAGCTDDEKSSAIKYWASMDSASTQTLSSYSDMLLYQEMEKATGVKVEFVHPVAGSTGQESFNTLLASKDLPDMIEYSWTSYPGGADAAINDGVILKLNDYLKDYAPNYYDYVAGEKNEEHGNRYKAETMTDSGNYYAFRSLNIGTSRGFCGLIVRADLLEKWGLETPETIADWDIFFAKAKSEGYEKPFTCYGNPINPSSGSNLFNTAWDVGKGFYLEGGKVVAGITQPGYKEYVAKMAEWVQKGYLDPNFVTNQATEGEANMTADNKSVACFGWIGSLMGKLMPAMETKNPEYNLVACPYPVLDESQIGTCAWQEVQLEARSPDIAITAVCKDRGNLEDAMKWCDYFYSEEGNVLKTFGVEGDTFTVEEIDGEKHYIYTDKIMKPETSGANSVNGALYKFFRPANSPGLNQHPDYLNGYYPYQCQKDALITWNENLERAREHVLPTLTYTSDESSRIATLNQQYQAGLDTDICKIILGEKNISEFDSIVSKAKSDFLDEIVKTQNAAYQRYLKKLNA